MTPTVCVLIGVKFVLQFLECMEYNIIISNRRESSESKKT